MTRKQRLFLIAPLAVLGIAAFIFVGGWLVMSLWNWLLPSLFGWPALTFWRAVGILALCRILFGGWGHRSGRTHSSMRRRMVDRVADRVGDRWQRMTSEEREQFRQRVRERCGFDPGVRETNVE
jgi:uncharacterized membrane protein